MDIVSPDARADLSTKYRTMLMQAQQAFMLGVLNKEDIVALGEIATDPLSLKGTLMSKEALDKQAKYFNYIMQKMQKSIMQSP